jgi:2,4-dienoyl-CoA reductase-like NADH-dependent reductase (Old Yellow Enzyme family)
MHEPIGSKYKAIKDAVHGKGGRIFAQIWHQGAVSHPSFLNALANALASFLGAWGASSRARARKRLRIPQVSLKAIEQEGLGS